MHIINYLLLHSWGCRTCYFCRSGCNYSI